MAERILETADRLFYGQGIRAMGVDTIAAEIGISKRTLYNHFPSKDALIVAYLQRRLRLVPTSDKPPAQQILDDFERLSPEHSDALEAVLRLPFQPFHKPTPQVFPMANQGETALLARLEPIDED